VGEGGIEWIGVGIEWTGSGKTTESSLTQPWREYHNPKEDARGIFCNVTSIGQGCVSCSRNHIEDRRSVARPY
jgi:hypothetical protein